jgi:hypothetical protein
LQRAEVCSGVGGTHSRIIHVVLVLYRSTCFFLS